MAVDANHDSSPTGKETLGFQAEIKQLLDIMVHSLYSNKEIFLRELISNASDAIDKLRFAMVSDESLNEDNTDFKIHVSYDKAARTVTVSDNGIGMNRDEVIEQIGTIARSGTREFFKSLTGDQQKDAHLIGQFGVGFYSSFVVADRVSLTTRRAGLDAAQGVRWESEGQGEYTVETIIKLERGTEVTLHLREGEDEFLDGYRLRSIIRKFSDHITVPIMMQAEGEDAHGEEQVNRASALWARSKSEISQEDYNEFYKHVAHDFEDPLAHIHSRIEGTQEYILLLFIPSHAPFDLWNRERMHGVKLYVRRVFIMDDAEKLMPGYLRFVRGVIDSNDLPLNVSRELLQQNRLLDTIRTTAVKRVLGLLGDLANNQKEKYTTFWNEFGRALKEGIAEDFANRETIAKLLRFSTTASEGEAQEVSLEEYTGRMKEGQDKIYYITADSHAAARNSPLLEIFKKKGIEVLLLSEPVDFILGNELREFNKIPLQSVSKGDIDLSKIADLDGESTEDKNEDAPKELLDQIKSALGERVKDVRVTSRLTTSPACIVVDQHDIDPSLERLLKAAGHKVPGTTPILEINPDHAIIRRLRDEQDSSRFNDWAAILFDQAVLSAGEKLDDPISFVNRLNNLLAQG